MAIALDDLINELQLSLSGLTSGQYRAAVERAVRAFSRKASMKRRTTLDIVSGTAAYSLPDDFMDIIRFESTLAADGVYSAPGGGLVPLSADGLPDRWEVTGKTITFYPTPTAAITYYMWYRAAHILDNNDVYQHINDEVIDILILAAQAEGLRIVNSGAAGDGWRYSFGDVTIDKSNQTKSLTNVINNLKKQFNEEVAAHMGPLGMQAGYHVSAVEDV